MKNGSMMWSHSKAQGQMKISMLNTGFEFIMFVKLVNKKNNQNIALLFCVWDVCHNVSAKDETGGIIVKLVFKMTLC